MAIIKDPLSKKQRKDPYALNGRKIRPIPREEFSADRDARNVMLAANAGKLSKGRNETNRTFGGATGGTQIRGGVGGGVYEPRTAPVNPGNIGTT